MSSEERWFRVRPRAHLLVVLTALLGASCADFSRGKPAGDAGDGGRTSDAADDGGTLGFASDVYPLLEQACASCHAAGQQAADTKLVLTGNAAADYAAVVALVDPAAAASSRLLSKTAGRGHQGGTIYAVDSSEYGTISNWIKQGAPP